MFFILNIFTLKNQIPTTKTVLPAYHKSLCVKSNKGFPEINIIERKNILNIFRIKKDKKEKDKIKILCFIFIFGIDRFRINKRKYAEPATQAPIISIGIAPIQITFDVKEELKKKLRRK
jgi:hypothetical protein